MGWEFHKQETSFVYCPMAMLVMVGSVVAVMLLKVGVVLLVAGRVRLAETVGCKGGGHGLRDKMNCTMRIGICFLRFLLMKGFKS